jgi:hypothetical protein
VYTAFTAVFLRQHLRHYSSGYEIISEKQQNKTNIKYNFARNNILHTARSHYHHHHHHHHPGFLFLGTSLEPTVNPTTQASSVGL